MIEALGFFDANIPSLTVCPVRTNAGLYVAAVAEGDDGLACIAARLPNPFASVCGRVCAAPCEGACRRGAIDLPVFIRAPKRFVIERYGVESGYRSSTSSVTAPVAVPRSETVGPAGVPMAIGAGL